MGISVVNGLQGPSDSRYKKLLACAKHFAVHSGPEWSRNPDKSDTMKYQNPVYVSYTGFFIFSEPLRQSV
jgi:hypothetical protein